MSVSRSSEPADGDRVMYETLEVSVAVAGRIGAALVGKPIKADSTFTFHIYMDGRKTTYLGTRVRVVRDLPDGMIRLPNGRELWV